MNAGPAESGAEAPPDAASAKPINPYLEHLGMASSSSSASAKPNLPSAAKSSQRYNPYAAHLGQSSLVGQPKRARLADPGNSFADHAAARRRRQGGGFAGFRILEAGELSRAAEKLQVEEEAARPDPHQVAAAAASSTVKVSVSSTAAFVPNSALTASQQNVPSVEWWDAAYLPKDARDAKGGVLPAFAARSDLYQLLDLKHHPTHSLIEHPVPIPASLISIDSNEPLKLYSTKKELKRMRRLAREAREQEKRDKIAIGLIPPDPPKVRLVNLPRVYGEELAANPTLIEAKVREEMERRNLEHQHRNLANKLTPEERELKRRAKFTQELERMGGAVECALFRVDNLVRPANLANKRQAKIFLTALRLGLGGRLGLLTEAGAPSFVLVEGGPRAVRKFARVMLRRIRWSASSMREALKTKRSSSDDENSDTEEDEEESSSEEEEAEEAEATEDRVDGRTSCYLVWRGLAPRREFEGHFRAETYHSALEARMVMAHKGVAHFWDAVVRFAPASYDARAALEGT